MYGRPAAVVLAMVIGSLALSAQAGAGPPASCFRHRHRCDLTYYEAAQALKQEVMQKLRPQPNGSDVACGPTAQHAPGFARCTITMGGSALQPPCTVEALLSHRKGAPFRIHWWKQSASCEA
jgi:hypothetical protein